MKKEKLPILAHHIRMFEWMTGSVRSFEDLARELVHSMAVGIIYPSGVEAWERRYPALQTKAGREAFYQALKTEHEALIHKQYRVLPEVDRKTKLNNFDLLCTVCGNREGDTCRLQRLNRSSRLF